MSVISFGGAPSYTISLDNLDLAYLGKYVSTPRPEKMPLWTKKRLDGESEYCQVEIVTRGNDNEDSFSEATDTYQCHICNINMPKNCYQRHNESKQHETFKNITQKVLERVSKQKYVVSMNTDEDIGSDSYYCEPCSKIIDTGNKNNHEATDYHAKAVKKSITINEFYKLLNANISNEVSEELLEEERVNSFNPNSSYDMYHSCTSMGARGSDESDDDHSILAPAPGHSTIEGVIQSPKVEGNGELLDEQSDSFIPNNNYDMCDKSMEASSIAIDDDPVQNSILAPVPGNSIIKTVNPSPKVEVNEELLEEESDPINPTNSSDMQDSCMNMEASSTNKSDDDPFDLDSILALVTDHCIIETVNEPPKVEEDKSFEEYLTKMIKRYNLEVTPPLSVYGDFIILVAPNGDRVKVSRENFHGYVVIRENMYCQICNMGIWGTDDTSKHDITKQHVRNLFKPINNNFARRLGKIWSHCIPCNALVVADSDLHALKSAHQQNIDSIQIPKPDKTRCEDCSLYVDTNSFSDHLNSETHLRTLELIEQNSIHNFSNNEVFCKICNQTLPKYALNFHIGTEPHLSRKINDSTVVSNENNETDINDENNVSSLNDKNNAGINDETNDAPAEIIDKNDSLATGVNVTDPRFCEMCKAKLPGELSSANINDIKPEVNEIDELLGTSASTGSSYSTYRINDSVATTSTMSNGSNYPNAINHGYETYDTCQKIIEFVDDARTMVRCKICFAEITYTESNLMNHMRGRNHMAILQIWEQYDKLKLEKYQWYNKDKMEKYNKKVVRKYTKLLFISHCLLRCEICDVNLSVDEKSLLSHTRGKNHVLATNYHYYRNGQKL